MTESKSKEDGTKSQTLTAPTVGYRWSGDSYGENKEKKANKENSKKKEKKAKKHRKKSKKNHRKKEKKSTKSDVHSFSYATMPTKAPTKAYRMPGY